MGKTIAELIAEGKSVEEISQMAQAEADAVATAKKSKIDPKEVDAARGCLIADMLDYVEAATGIEFSEKKADEATKDLTDKLKFIELLLKATDLAESENKSKPKFKVEKDTVPMSELFSFFRFM